MKLSVSLSDEQVADVDQYARSAGLGSRSAVIQKAVRMLTDSTLDEEYAEAWQEWEGSEDAVAWESTIGDGLVAHAQR